MTIKVYGRHSILDAYGLTVSQNALLRCSKDDGLVKNAGIPRRAQTREETDAKDGTLCHLSKEKDLHPGGVNREISVSAPLCEHRTTESGLEHGHHLYPIEPRVCLSGCSNGLVFSLRVSLGIE